MAYLRSRKPSGPPGAGRDDLGVARVRLVVDSEPCPEAPAAREALRRIVDEAVLLQDLAEDLLIGIRERRSLAELARPGGALVSRFVALRAAVPEPAGAGLDDMARTLRETLDHHALMLSCSLDLLADLRPERVSEQLDRLDGLGAPARRLRALQDQLRA